MATDPTQYLADLKLELAEVRAAISAVLKRQSYALDDGQAKQTVTFANLNDLRKYRDDLNRQILELENSTPTVTHGRTI